MSDLPNFEYIDDEKLREQLEEDIKEAKSFAEPMPLKFSLPFKDEYFDAMCSQMQQPEIHQIRSRIEVSLDDAALYLDTLREKYQHEPCHHKFDEYCISRFLKELQEAIIIYNRVQHFDS